MFDIAIASDQIETAERLLSDAEQRGADPQEIEQRKVKLGLDPEGEIHRRPAIIR